MTFLFFDGLGCGRQCGLRLFDEKEACDREDQEIRVVACEW